MFIITPMGKKREVRMIIPMIEDIRVFNCRIRRSIEDANNIDCANGVKIVFSENHHIFNEDNIIIGNLSNKQVKEIIRAERCYDFSLLKYQKIDKLEDLVIGEEALPYNSEMYRFLSDNTFDFFMTPPSFDERCYDDIEDEDDLEELEDAEE